MPYVTQNERNVLDKSIETLLNDIQTDGQLNYVISKLCIGFAKPNNQSTCYNLINSVVGILECAKLEFYRRLATEYEDYKITTNGDVY